MEVARSDRFTTNQRVQIMQSTRNALNAIGRDALNAGNGVSNNGVWLPDNALNTVLGLPADVGTTADLLTSVIAGRLLNPNDLSITAANPAGINTDQVTFVFQDFSFNGGRAVNVTNIPANGSQITIDTTGADGIAGNADDISNNIFALNNLLIVTGPTRPILPAVTNGPPASALGMMTITPAGNTVNFASPDPLGINALNAGLANPIGTVINPATVSRVTWVTYRVLRDGTLVRTEYGNNADPTGRQDMPLAYGVEAMQVEYVLANGTTNLNPAVGVDGVLGSIDDDSINLQNVRQVRVTITTQSPEMDRRNNQRFRTTLASTFNTRNLGYDTR